MTNPTERSQPMGQQGNLKLYNSFSRRKEVFTPSKPGVVKWYICGPTVYDSAHMGHARTYISFDIIRRLLEDYFGYNVLYCMNITDIDDKIIKRARERYLIDWYFKEKSNNQIEKDIVGALKLQETIISAEEDLDKKEMRETILTKAKDAFRTHLQRKQANSDERKTDFSDFMQILPDWLDATYGKDVKDHKIFVDLARFYETEFHKDLKSLNIRPASVLTRVSEYIDEIIYFIKLIIRNGFAYSANGSVYFDTNAFRASGDHVYPKLLPEAAMDVRSLTEGEGVLSHSAKILNDKKSKSDFALWKKSKPGEPTWNSPWGMGRPGWHIECSAMACSILGENMDIHSGGIDLKFPHHENEIAQTEAAYNSNNWIKYFLHSGHLTIQGCKMSKSLKNFITIRKSLEMYTHRQIRILFLLHNWADTLDFSENAMRQAINYEKLCQEFFLLVKDCIRNMNPRDANSQRKWTTREFNLNDQFDQIKVQVHQALCDSFDTVSAMNSLKTLISACYAYMNDREHSNALHVLLVQDIARYIDKLFNIFGLVDETDDFGFTESTLCSSIKDSSGWKDQSMSEAMLMPYVQALVEFRDTVRTVALQHKDYEMLKICDAVRDHTLLDLGVKLEDRDGRTVIKIYDPEVLKLERKRTSEKKKESQDKSPENDCSIVDQNCPAVNGTSTKAKNNSERKQIPPWELFISDRDKYSAFDEKGFPTADSEGKPLTKSAIKKLTKVYQLQEKRYNEFLNKN